VWIVFGTTCIAEASAPSCDSVCIGLAVGLTIGVVVLVAIIVLVIVAYRRGRLPSPRLWTNGVTSTDTTGTSPHRTVIHVNSDNLAEENHNGRIAYTPESIDSDYLHLERRIVFNEAI